MLPYTLNKTALNNIKIAHENTIIFLYFLMSTPAIIYLLYYIANYYNWLPLYRYLVIFFVLANAAVCYYKYRYYKKAFNDLIKNITKES